MDNHAYGNTLCGLPVISFDELCSKHKDAFIYVATTLYHKEIERQLMDNDFPRENLLFWDKAMQENKQAQYFDLPFLLPDKGEVFIDMGAYDGLTSLAFTGWSRGQYSKIYAFEPNKKAYDLCKRQCEAIPRCEFISKGVCSKTGELKFIIDEGNHQASHISEDSGGETISVVALDDILSEEKITFLKVDVEGAELEALKGAAKLVRRCKPKIAFSLYHKAEDIWELPSKILSLCPDYKLYLRHYSFTAAETVLYAV